MAVLDFTSALYLGLRHPSAALRPWMRLTGGRPAALAVPARQHRVADGLARLTGCERALLAPSTLHLFWDLFGMLGGADTVIHMDAGLYPIARWGVERAACRGTTVRRFAHFRPASLRRQLRRDGMRRPVVVVDGFCPGCGKPAPLRELLDLIRPRGGLLVIDDTQALGIFGHAPSAAAPFGRGGGGSLRLQVLTGPDVLLVSSLAKGFGVPAAMLGGGVAQVREFERRSETRIHCSPPSLAALHAAAHALAVNRDCGDALRLRLALRVRRLRAGLEKLGRPSRQGVFPVQTLAHAADAEAVALHARLLRRGVRTVLHRARDGRGARLSFLITARHGPQDIDAALDALAAADGPRIQREDLEVTHGTAADGGLRGLR